MAARCQLADADRLGTTSSGRVSTLALRRRRSSGAAAVAAAAAIRYKLTRLIRILF